MSIKLLAFSTLFLMVASYSTAARPSVAYTEAGKYDSSFNEAVFREGVTPYRAQFGSDLIEKSPSSPTQFVEVLTDLARGGRSPVVAVSSSYASAVEQVAKAYPNVQFILIDAVVELPNVQSIVFKEHEGSFVVGALAALKSKSGKLGFVGGMESPAIRRFGCGFAQGALYVNKKSKVQLRMVSKGSSGFADADKAQTIAQELIGMDVDVLYAVAGGSGVGVYDAAANHSKVFAIGVDSNQNYLHPGTMLTSMVKKVGGAAFDAWNEARQGTWKAGVKSLGFAENGIEWQLDIFNRNLVSLKDEKKINDIRDDIISGKIEVVDYLDNNQCPVTMLEG